MARNIELKARCEDLDVAGAAAVRVGAVLTRSELQRDTYFDTTSGRLKLRECWNLASGTGPIDFTCPDDPPARAELIWYHRRDEAVARGSDYTIVHVMESGALRGMLAGSLGVVSEVVKRRTLYMLDNVRIHLDAVRGLGTFIEFEAVMSPGRTDEAERAKVERLQAEFRIAPSDILSGSYSDMLQA